MTKLEMLQAINEKLAMYLQQAKLEPEQVQEVLHLLEDGFLPAEDAPRDAFIDFGKNPTHMATALLMREFQKGNSEVEEALNRALAKATALRLNGHGYEDTKNKIELLEMYANCGLAEFLDYDPAFTQMIHETVNELTTEKASDPWGEPMESRIKKLRKEFNMKKYYIAYGSNMDEGQMKDRCKEAERVDSSYLDGWQLTMPSYANIEKNPEARTPILIWKISEKDEARLDVYEAVEEGLYYKDYLTIEINGKPEKALVYLMTDNPRNFTRSVRDGYEEQILKAYEDHGFSREEFQPKYFK